MKLLILPILLLSLLPLAISSPPSCIIEKQLLERGDIVTFNSNEMTIGLRNPPRPQVLAIPNVCHAACIKGNVECTYFSREKWDCVADISKIYIWGKINVDCEGYPNRDSPHILKDSCQFQYQLVKRWSSWWQLMGIFILSGFVGYCAQWWVPILCVIIITCVGAGGAKRRRHHRLRGRATGSRS